MFNDDLFDSTLKDTIDEATMFKGNCNSVSDSEWRQIKLDYMAAKAFNHLTEMVGNSEPLFGFQNIKLSDIPLSESYNPNTDRPLTKRKHK